MILQRIRASSLVFGTLLLVSASSSRAGDCGGYFEGPLGRYEVPCPGPIHGPSDRDDRRSAAEPRSERGAVSDADLGGAITDIFGALTAPFDALWSLLESARDSLKRARAERLRRRLEAEDLSRRIGELRAESRSAKEETDSRIAGTILLAQASFEEPGAARAARKDAARDQERARRAAEPKLDPVKKRRWVDDGGAFDAAIDSAWKALGEDLKGILDRCAFKAILAQETAFGTNPKYLRQVEKKKAAGIVGPWQIADKTWREVEPGLSERFGDAPKDRYDHAQSTYGAALYLRRIEEKMLEPLIAGSNATGAEKKKFLLAAYNMGFGRFRDVWRQAGRDLGRTPTTWAELGGENPNPTTGSPLGQVLWEQRTKGRKKPSQFELRGKAYDRFAADFRERASYPGKVLDWSRYCQGGR